MPKAYAARARAQVRQLLDIIEASCQVCGADLLWVSCHCNGSPCEVCGGMGGWIRCPNGPHDRQDEDRAFQKLEHDLPEIYDEPEPPLAEIETAILPGPARAEIYRERFDAKRAIFHPADGTHHERIARVVGHNAEGTFWRGPPVAETSEDDSDAKAAQEISDHADEIVIRYLFSKGWQPRSERFQALARRVCAD